MAGLHRRGRSAAQADGYAYVFDTDINDFFPSVNRTSAKAFLAARTKAHSSVLELLFYCLEAWLPRFAYAPMTGLPVETSDVSRLVAHNYLKNVDAIFKSEPDCIYLSTDSDQVQTVTLHKAHVACAGPWRASDPSRTRRVAFLDRAGTEGSGEGTR